MADSQGSVERPVRSAADVEFFFVAGMVAGGTRPTVARREFRDWLAERDRKAAVEAGVCEHQNANYLRMMSERDALRAEVERLRAGWCPCVAGRPQDCKPEDWPTSERHGYPVRLREAVLQVADLRAGIRGVPSTPGDVQGLKGRQAATYRAGWEAAGREYRALLAGSGEQPGERERAWLNADPRKAAENLRAVVGASEQPGEVYGPRPTACCGKCPPIEGGGYDCTCEGNPRCVRERVRDVFVNAERRESFGGTDIDALTDAVLAVVGQGVTAEQREQAVASLYRMFEAAKAVKGARRAGKTALSRDLQAILAVVRPTGQEGS